MTERITSGLRIWTSDHFGVGDWRYESIMDFADRIDAELAERYVELPKDADGEVIHVGDKLDDGWQALQGEVQELILNHDGWWFRFKDKCELFYVHEFHKWHHYHAPTVEDVLREMLDKWGELPSNMTNEAIIAEYAAKLRLADDAE